MSIFSRLFSGKIESPAMDPKRLLPVTEVKASPTSLLPRGAYGAAYEFFSPDGGRTIIDQSHLSSTALAFCAYWYVAVRWRAQKLAEAPLMVIEEDQETGDEEWLAEHELAEVLLHPSEDYDMGDLIERTSAYLDNSGQVLWVCDRDRGQRIARITPFQRGEFKVASSDQRMYQTFTVNTSKGPREFDAEQVCYFRDNTNADWMLDGKSRLDVAMNWLRLGETSRQTIRDLLGNAIWPSAVVIPDKDWNPDPKTLELYKQDLERYAKQGVRGKPFVQLGGGSFETLSASIKDLVPTDVLNRVESIVAAVSGVPAIVLQFQIGMENSPWSQMEEARKMAYDDTIMPTWRRLERVMTRQMLRRVDDDPTHFIRFDKSDIDALKQNQLESAQIATAMGRAASLNERRAVMGLEPVDPKDDPEGRADQIPELTQPTMADLLAQQATNKPEDGTPPKPADKPTDDAPPPPNPAKFIQLIERKAKSLSLGNMLRDEAVDTWQTTAHGLLLEDREVIIDIVNTLLTDTMQKTAESKSRGKDSVMRAVSDYLAKESRAKWTKKMTPLMAQGAERAIAVHSADLGVSYNVLHPTAIRFAQKNSSQMITEVSKTTRRLINDIITGGLQENRSTTEIAQVIADATGFSKSRARLIARTETTSIFSGAPIASLSAYAKTSDRVFLKTWFGVMDEKERDEHVEMEGETVQIDEPFSNGLQYPSEPNCRCHVLTHEQESDE